MTRAIESPPFKQYIITSDVFSTAAGDTTILLTASQANDLFVVSRH
jgi:hypothetical protein